MSFELMSRLPDNMDIQKSSGSLEMTTTAAHTPIVAIRPATDDDTSDLLRLAGLDSSVVPAGELLLGIVDGELRAAVALTTGKAIADPFHHTADVVALLRLRASRLRKQGIGVAPRRRLRSLLPA
jgi:hypothetical protein